MSAGPPFVAGEAMCAACARAHRIDLRWSGTSRPRPLLACVVCTRRTRCRVKG